LIRLSVITCSHNPRADYLGLVLEALAVQTLDQSDWEYLLIDNASEQPLAPRFEIEWHSAGRHIREEKPGLTHARLRGIREARGQILVFVDDDNVLDRDYLEVALNIADHWPMIGAFSGQVRPRFEQTPAEWTRKYWNHLAIREFSEDRWSNIPCLQDTAPNGAGLCVHRHVALEYLTYHESGKRPFVLDRTGESLLSAGDLDLAATACDLGLGNGLFTSLKLTHLMPPERLEESYLLRLLEAQTFSFVVLYSFRSKISAEPAKGLKTKIADQLRLLSKSPRERRFSQAIMHGERRALSYLSNGHQV